MKNVKNSTIVIAILVMLTTVMSFLTWGAIQSSERSIATLSENFEFKISQIQDKMTGEKTVIIERTYNQNGKDGSNGAKGDKGDKGDAGANGLDGSSVTSEQIAVAVAQYLILNPPQKGDTGQPGADGIDGNSGREIEFCRQRDGRIGQRYVGDTICKPIETTED